MLIADVSDLKEAGAGVKLPGTSLNQKRNWFGGDCRDEVLGLSSLIEDRRTFAPTFLVKFKILNIVTEKIKSIKLHSPKH